MRSHLRSPFLCDRLGQPGHTSLGQTVVGLSGVAVGATRAADVDDTTVLAILDPEVRGRLSDQSEGCRVVHINDRVPLLVGDLVNHPVPGVPGVIDDDVDLATSKLGRLVHQHGEVAGVRHIAGHGDGAVGARIVDGLCDGLGFGGIHVAHHHLCAFVGEEAGAFGSDTLARTGDLEEDCQYGLVQAGV